MLPDSTSNMHDSFSCNMQRQAQNAKPRHSGVFVIKAKYKLQGIWRKLRCCSTKISYESQLCRVMCWGLARMAGHWWDATGMV